MPDFDWNVYNATRDRPGGPVVIDAPDFETSMVEPMRDADGNLSVGTKIVYSISLTFMLGLFLYFRFAV